MGKCKSCGGLILVPPPNMQRPQAPPQPVAPQQQSPLAPTPPRPTAPPPQPYAPPSPYGQAAYPQQPQYGAPSPFTPPPNANPYGAPPSGYGIPTTPYAPPNPYGQPQPYVPPSPYPAQQYPQQQYPQQPAYPQQPYPQQPAMPHPGMDRTPVRLKRLQAEAAQVQKAFAGFPNIRLQAMQGEPPERYVIEYRVRGLVRSPQGPIYQDQHYAEIQLTSEYPRQAPKCRMLTPIFHPNFEPATICVGDHWTAGERLVDLIIRIAEMIAFQQYNIKSPLDGEAAMWTDQNRQHLPTDPREMRPPNLA
jgi:ubiquitin-protein ligase